MEFKLKGNNNYKDNALETIFINRGVENAKELLQVSLDSVIHHSKLKNINHAVDVLINICNKEEVNIFVQVDSDADGYTSASVLIMEIQRLFPHVNITWRIHKGKEHGVIVNTVPEDTDLIIIPDAGSNQVEEMAELYKNGYTTIVLDHHEIEEGIEDYAIVVNPQLSPEYENKELSGVGVVYKFIKALGEKLGDDNSDHYLDLVAIGNIGDMVDLRSKETRYYVKTGLEQINNPLMKALVEKQDFSMGGIINIHTIAFFITPLINACIRAGKPEEKENMFKAMIGSNETIYYKRNDVDEHITVAVARNLTNIRTRQNNAKDKVIKLVKQQIEDNNLIDDKVLIIEMNDKNAKNLNGLVANQLVKQYKRPMLILKRNENEGVEVLAGSARGFENGEIKDLNTYLLESNLVNYCKGHANAFGVEINVDNVEQLKHHFNSTLKHDIGYAEIDVDFIIPCEDVDYEFVRMIGSFRDEWGGTLPEPKIAITDVELKFNDMELTGKYKNTLKTKVNGVNAVKKYFNQDKFNETFGDMGESFIVDLLCTFKVNEWNNEFYAQIQIEDINVKEVLYF